jgi:hypothetical protein
MWLENKNIRTINKNMKCARQMWKRKFIMSRYANMNIKRTWQGNDARLCLRLELNRLKKWGILFLFIPLLQIMVFQEIQND